MKQSILIVSLLIFLHAFLSAQTPPVKYGEVTRADLESEPYRQEQGAEAIVLNEFAVAKILYEGGFKVEYTRQVRIKILKAGGLSLANVEIPFRANYEISDLKACTHNLDNDKPVTIALTKKQFIREEVSTYRKAMRFTLPQVRVGSIIEYTYRMRKPTIMTFQPFDFQWTIPVRHVEFWAVQPRFFLYNINFHGNGMILQQHTEEQGYFDSQPTMVDIYKYTGDMLPAFEGEPNMPEGNVCYAGVNYSLARVNFPGIHTEDVAISYQKLSEQLLDNADLSRQVENTLLFTKSVRDITAGMNKEEDKIKAIYSYVQKNFMWDGYDELLPEDNLLKVFRDKSGTSAELNILLVNMLKTAGIMADPVVTSTRDNGPVNTLVAMADNLNYTLCLAIADGKEYLLDVTDKYTPMGSLPFKCMNVEGWVLSRTRGRWVKLLTSEKFAIQEFYALNLTPEGNLTGTCQASFAGYDAARFRRLIHNEGETGFRYKVLDIPGTHVTVSNIRFENLDNIDETLNVRFDLVIRDAVQHAGSLSFFKPNFSLFGDFDKAWIRETRRYPIDMGSPTRNNYSCIITLPEGYTISELPENTKIAVPNDDASFHLNIARDGHQLSVKYDLKINSVRFETDQYPAFREFYTQVNRKINDMVILTHSK